MLTQSNQIQNRITTFNCLINKHRNFKKYIYYTIEGAS